MANENNYDSEFAELKIRGKIFKLPMLKASIGEDVIDISRVSSEADCFTYDPGFMSTASCRSTITYIDGDKGILRHRGYDIKDLAEKSNFLEVAYLLIYGELPSNEQYNNFTKQVAHHSLVNERLHYLFQGAVSLSVEISRIGYINNNIIYQE